MLDRHPRGISPTEAGVAFFDKARAALRATDEAYACLARGNERMSRCASDSSQAYGEWHGRCSVATFRRTHRSMCRSATSRSGERLCKLRQGEIDAEIVFPPPRDADIVVETILVAPRYVSPCTIAPARSAESRSA